MIAHIHYTYNLLLLLTLATIVKFDQYDGLTVIFRLSFEDK